MKKNAIFVIYFVISVCFTSHTVGQSRGLIAYNNVLFQAKKLPRYIFVANDTAYYERRQSDKPSYTTDFDTLAYKRNCNCYRGKFTNVSIANNDLNLIYLNGRDSAKNIIFIRASNKETRYWINYKNSDKYMPVAYIVRSLLEANKSNTSFYHLLDKDWENLGAFIKVLNRKDFDVEMNKFKFKYSIK
jgi:hypothetical protein